MALWIAHTASAAFFAFSFLQCRVLWSAKNEAPEHPAPPTPPKEGSETPRQRTLLKFVWVTRSALGAQHKVFIPSCRVHERKWSTKFRQLSAILATWRANREMFASLPARRKIPWIFALLFVKKKSERQMFIHKKYSTNDGRPTNPIYSHKPSHSS